MITSIRLPDNLEKRLAKLAKMTGKKKSSFIIEALTEYLADLEDYSIVAKRMQEYDPTENVSLNELKALYDLED